MPERLFVGLFAGSACDGVDAALACIRGRGERIKAEQRCHLYRPFSQDLRGRLMQWSGLARAPKGSAGGRGAFLPAPIELDRDVGRSFAEAVEKLLDRSGADRDDIAGLGASGQALGQVGSGVVAQTAQLPVISGFGASDVAAGGSGRPITAWADWRLLRHRRLSRVAVHLGGVATVTFIGSGAVADDVVAFDVGPGTLVIDQVCRQHFRRAFDADGATAARGRVHANLLHELLAHPYFLRKPPKAAAPQEWGWLYRQRVELAARKRRCGPEDLLATVTELTAQAVARAVGALTERPHEVILSGGGGLNIHLAGRVRSLLCPSSTYTFEKYGPDLRGKQAVCMAMLGAARLDKFAAHCPRATGAARRAVLGSVTLP